MTANHSQHWSQAGDWMQQVQDWMQQQLDKHQLQLSGTIEQIHIQPWSTILRVPSSDGELFFKASIAILSHEAALIAYLAGIAPEHLPQLVAVDPAHGWMLMRDAGQRLRESMIAEPDLKFWEALLPDFAQLQIDAAQGREQFLAMGIPNRSLEQLPQLYGQLLAQEARFRVGQSDGLSAAQYQRLHDLKPVFRQKCEQLASYAIPESLHHGDLHDGNIFYHKGRYLFLDWGDCSLSHPFFSLRTAYVSAEMRLDLEEGSPQLERLRDAYLPGWRRFEAEETLIEAFGLAEELWAISSALIWYRAITSLDESLQEEFAHVIPSLAQEFLGLIKE